MRQQCCRDNEESWFGVRGGMQGEEDRIDGWKSIAAYIGRDRSTAIRWFNERNLPVHSLPGGKSRTVYALKPELDAWMRGGDEPASASIHANGSVAFPLASSVEHAPRPPDALTGSTLQPVLTSKYRRKHIVSALCAVLILCLCAAGVTIGGDAGTSAPDRPLPHAAKAALLRAREDIASRSTDQIDGAIATLTRLSHETPDHAGIHAALAEGYLLAREFGSLPDALALERARSEAEQVLVKRPDSATAWRVLGVVRYWRDRDVVNAGEAFRRAVAAKPGDALAHQWYGNVLADNGETDAAFREFDAARQLNPGAPYLLTDYAWALWSAGRVQEADRLLNNLARRYPTLASVHDCLSVAALARGDLAGYARHLRARASMRGAPELVSYSRLVDQAVGDPVTLQQVMMTRALAQADATSKSDHSWAAFVASSFGDRAQVIAILRRALVQREQWGAFGFTRRIAARWQGDAAVLTALDGLAQPPIEP